jgi:hypothetical protein
MRNGEVFGNTSAPDPECTGAGCSRHYKCFNLQKPPVARGVRQILILTHSFRQLACLQRCAALCCAVLSCAVLCFLVLCCALLCCAVLCSALLRSALRCCAVLCCAVLCCAVLCCAALLGPPVCCVLYCAVLCCVIGYRSALTLTVCLPSQICTWGGHRPAPDPRGYNVTASIVTSYAWVYFWDDEPAKAQPTVGE